MRGIWLVGCAVALVALAGPALAAAPVGAAAQKAPTFDTVLPSETVLYVSVRNVPDALVKVKQTSGYKIFEQLKVLERLVPPEKYAELQKLYGTFIEPLGGICRGEVALAAMSFDVEEGGQPRLALLIDVTEGQNALNDYLEKTIFPLLAEKGIKPESQEVEGITVTKIVPAPERQDAVFYAVKGGVLIVSPRLDTLSELLANVGPSVGGAKAMLPSNTLFADVTKAIGQADFTVYINVATLIKKAVENDEQAKVWMPLIGLYKLRAVGLGTRIGADGSGTTVIRLATEGEPTAWGNPVTRDLATLKSLKRVPGDMALYTAGDCGSLTEAYKQLVANLDAAKEAGGGDTGFGMVAGGIEAGIEQIETALGMSLADDVLPGFGGEVAFALKVPEAIGVPPMAIMIEVKDKEKVQQFVDRVLELVQTSGGDGGVRVLTSEYNGVEIDTVITTPMLSPAVAVLDDFLVVATSAETLKAIIDAGKDGKTIAQREDFVATMAGLPKTGAGVFYLDLREVYDFVFPIVASQVPAEGPAGDVVKDLGKLGEYLGGIGLVAAGDPSGLTYTLYSKKALLEPVILCGGAVVIPAFMRAREVAEHTASMSNVKQLCMAISMYENENGALPGKLSDLAPYVGEASMFLHPDNRPVKAGLIDLDKPETIEANSDYELVIKGGSLEEIENPSETVIIREKQVFWGNGRVQGFADGHVEFSPEPPSGEQIEGDGAVKIEEGPAQDAATVKCPKCGEAVPRVENALSVVCPKCGAEVSLQ